MQVRQVNIFGGFVRSNIIWLVGHVNKTEGLAKPNEYDEFTKLKEIGEFLVLHDSGGFAGLT